MVRFVYLILTRYQIPPLVKQGYKLYLVDMKGYNLSEKPASIDEYTLAKITKELVEIVQQINQENKTKCFLIGHDWGGAFAQLVTYLYKSQVYSFEIQTCTYIRVYIYYQFNTP